MRTLIDVKHYHYEHSLKIVSKLEEIGKRYNKTEIQIGISWVMRCKGVISSLIGQTKVAFKRVEAS